MREALLRISFGVALLIGARGCVPPAEKDVVVKSPKSFPRVVTAVEELRHLCDEGNGVACLKLGLAYLDGTDVAKDVGRAQQCFQRGCDGGQPAACYDLAVSYVETHTNEPRAARLFDQVCSQGDLNGCEQLAVMLLGARGVARDERRALSLFERACNHGISVACANAAWVYQNGSPELLNPKSALELSARACIAGVSEGCRGMADVYSSNGAMAIASQNLALLERKCDAGDLRICGSLGTIADARQDFVRARRFWEKACASGIASYCNNLGVLFDRGEGVPRDPKAALAEWVRSAI